MSNIRLVRAAEFMSRLGIKKSKFYNLRKEGIIPPPVALTKKTCAWPSTIVEKMIFDITQGKLSL